MNNLQFKLLALSEPHDTKDTRFFQRLGIEFENYENGKTTLQVEALLYKKRIIPSPFSTKQQHTVYQSCGEGRYAKVFVCAQNINYVVKKCLKRFEGEDRDVLNEIECQNIIAKTLHFAPTIHRVIHTRDAYFLVMDKIEGKTLSCILSSPHSLQQRLQIFLKITRYVRKMHKLGVFHCDLHHKNIMLQNGTFSPLFIDFERSVYKKDGHIQKEQSVDFNYLGILLFSLLTNGNSALFFWNNDWDLIKKGLTTLMKESTTIQDCVLNELVNILANLDCQKNDETDLLKWVDDTLSSISRSLSTYTAF